MKRIVFTALLSVFIATHALADNTGRFYVAGDIGSATYGGLPAGWSKPNVIRVAGGFHYSSVFALELGYSRFGDSTYSYAPAITSASSFQIAAIGSLPLSQQFDLIGKLGLASNVEDYFDATGNAASYSRNDLLVGFGVQFNINSQVSVRALYDNYGKFDKFFPPMKATSLSLGVVCNF